MTDSSAYIDLHNLVAMIFAALYAWEPASNINCDKHERLHPTYMLRFSQNIGERKI